MNIRYSVMKFSRGTRIIYRVLENGCLVNHGIGKKTFRTEVAARLAIKGVAR